MTRIAIRTLPVLVVFCSLLSSRAAAQTAPWTAILRGSWVQTAPAVAGDVTLAADLTVSQIVVADDESNAVHQAAEFLAGDIEQISAHRPRITNTPAAGQPNIHLVTLGHGAVPAAINVRAIQGQWESYRIVTADRDVWLIGSYSRGTAFAAYTLSERLGIDPLYIWTGYAPEHHDPLILKPTNFTQGPPAFRYRGFFHDDEDLLVQKLASDWGLYYTSHHYDILVSNPWGLERFNLAAERGVRPDYNWFTNRDGMLTFWRGGVRENRDLDVIWPVGMRGTADRPFIFPEGTSDAQKAATFREVIQQQVSMVRKLIPKDKTPLFHFTMYSEMLPEYQKNPAAFDLPDDVMIVWPDDNDGHMRALPAALGKWKHGVYYHLALGLEVVQRQAEAALKLEEALRAPDTAHMWPLVLEARTPLEQRLNWRAANTLPSSAGITRAGSARP
jgi:hypothetical protein